jgi:hypothetical protein
MSFFKFLLFKKSRCRGGCLPPLSYAHDVNSSRPSTHNCAGHGKRKEKRKNKKEEENGKEMKKRRLKEKIKEEKEKQKKRK